MSNRAVSQFGAPQIRDFFIGDWTGKISKITCSLKNYSLRSEWGLYIYVM